MKKFNVAVVGATGMVGNKFLEVLTERKLPIENYYLFASKKSAGKEINFMEKKHTVIELNDANIEKLKGKLDFALFSAGGSVSAEFAPKFVKIGAVVVDNSSQWRMDDNVPLVVPEVNPEDIKKHNGIIANPNCSTIQAMVALKPLYDAYGIKRVIYSTYQAVSGAGIKGYSDLKENKTEKFPYPILNNMLPHIDVFTENGYTKEELKMVNETRKILHDKKLKVTATTVRVPVFYGHSESINVELKKRTNREDVMKLYASAPGIVLQDDVKNNIYPMPINAENKDEVFIGRIRMDDSVKSGVNIWVVADNIRKGAATNAVQILELLMQYNTEQ